MNRNLYALGAALALSVATSALADDKEPGFYVGAGVGEYTADLNQPTNAGNVALHFNGNANKIFGGWRFFRALALQVDYTDFKDSGVTFGATTSSNKTQSLSPNVVATLPVGPVELFAKAGILFSDVHVNTANGSAPLVNSSSHDPVYGAGIGVTIAKRVDLRAEYERIQISDFDKPNAVWLTAAWHF
jgi:opacity protein-like surface antigen